MEAIRDLQKEGYQISLDGENIKCRKLEGANPDPVKINQLFSEIRNKKAEALMYLKKRFIYDRHLQDAIARLNEAGLNIMKASDLDREQALDLEIELTKAANERDIDQFIKLVDVWKSIFLKGNTVTN